MTVEQRRDPIFDENIDLSIGQKASECEDRGRGEHGIANRAQTYQQNLSHVVPVPARRCEWLGCVLTLQAVHRLCFDDAYLWREFNDVAQAIHRIILRCRWNSRFNTLARCAQTIPSSTCASGDV